MKSGPLARVTDLTKRFGGFTAVDCASLDVSEGEVVGLIGANGAGKTTLIRMMLGLLTPTSGHVELFGGPPTRATRRRLGYVSQGLGLYTDLSVAENVEFAAAAFDRPVEETVLPDDLGEHRGRRVGEIGLGLQRRLAFAIALGHGPDLLVLDEPTSGVDPLARARLWDQIHDAADSGVAVLVTTHYMHEARQTDRLVVMAGGRIAARGSTEDITHGVPVVRVETASWSDAFSALGAAGASVMLDGRQVRVAMAEPEEVSALLREAGIDARVQRVDATLDEAMLTFALAATTTGVGPDR